MTYFVSLPGNKKDPPAGPAPAWSALRERRISDFCHGGIKVVRPVGTAPTSPAWKAEILLLNDGRFLKNGRWSWNRANLSGSSGPRTSFYAIQRYKWRARPVLPRLGPARQAGIDAVRTHAL